MANLPIVQSMILCDRQTDRQTDRHVWSPHKTVSFYFGKNA